MKKVLEKGFCWRVDQGNRISIIYDARISGSLDFRLANPVSVGNLELVADLIEPTTREWRADVLTQAFCEADADRIRHIPLTVEPCEDELVWKLEPSGEFSIKSSYNLLHKWSYPPTSINLQTTIEISANAYGIQIFPQKYIL